MAKRGRKFEYYGKTRISEMDAEALESALQECMGQLKDAEERAKVELREIAFDVIRRAVAERWSMLVADAEMRKRLA